MKNVTDGQVRYLVAMYCLKQKKPGIRSVELSRMLGVTRASVNGMLTSLVDAGLIAKERYGDISFTAEGEVLAAELHSGFCAAKTFFSTCLSLDETKAWQAAMVFLSAQQPECVQKLKKWMDQASFSSWSAT